GRRPDHPRRAGGHRGPARHRRLDRPAPPAGAQPRRLRALARGGQRGARRRPGRGPRVGALDPRGRRPRRLPARARRERRAHPDPHRRPARHRRGQGDLPLRRRRPAGGPHARPPRRRVGPRVHHL
ncbi:MAG: hypothetical protein AVDCRST_MAG30-3059, partial [uncultured Solirubrobacteraceae bacterium]